MYLRQMRRLILSTLLVACSGNKTLDSGNRHLQDTGPDTGADTSACWDDLAPGRTAVVAAGLTGGTEGIAFVDGRLLVTGEGGLFEVGADGTVQGVVSLSSALGLAPLDGGVLLADPGEFTFDGSGDDGRLLQVDLDGDIDVLAEGMPNPNFVVQAPWGDILVSDDTIETVHAVSPAGEVRPWLGSLPSANGMALSADGGTLYAVSTFVADSPVWAVPVDADGSPGEPQVLANLSPNALLDGVALDAEEGLWVAANIIGEIWRVDTRSGEAAPFATDLDTPASLAFGAGEHFDPCSIYYTELFGEELMRLSTGVPGLPLTGAR